MNPSPAILGANAVGGFRVAPATECFSASRVRIGVGIPWNTAGAILGAEQITATASDVARLDDFIGSHVVVRPKLEQILGKARIAPEAFPVVQEPSHAPCRNQ